jgi:hypothetical protein
MKKLILGFAVVATTALSSSAFAWRCRAEDSYSTSWGQSFQFPDLNKAQEQALYFCTQSNISNGYPNYCHIVGCW